MTLRAVIVAAVSTTAQAADGHGSIPEQLAACRAACESHAWQVASEITIPGHSRDYAWLHEIIRDCPEYDRLIALVETGSVDLVVCRHYDRLWRTSALQAQVMALCRQHSVQVYSTTQPREPIDPSLLPKRPGLQGIVESLSGFLSEEEQNIRVARLRAGMAGRIAQGKHHCVHPPYGYMHGDDGLLIPDAAQVPWVKQMFAWAAEGHGRKAICQRLHAAHVPPPSGHIWWMNTARRILGNPVYTGMAIWGEQLNTQGTHPALVDAATFARVQEYARARSFLSTPKTPGAWLARLLRCGLCGHVMHYYQGHGWQLRCSFHIATNGKDCLYNGHSGRRVHAFVLAALQDALANRDAWLAARAAQQDSQALETERDTLNKALADVEARRERWAQAYEVGAISLTEWLQHRARLDAEVGTIRPRLDAIERRLADSTPPALVEFAEFAESLATQPPDVLARVARAMIHHVTLTQGQPPVIMWR